MIVVLAEKPSVARDLAAALGARARRDGYFEGEGYQVTWAFGHLVGLQEPEDYDPALKRWSLDSLPILPQPFRLKLQGDEGARKQFHCVARLFQAAESLVCATDAGREGELIFRYIQEMAECLDKPVQRLWLSSLTETAIRKGLQRMRPGDEFDRLYAAARCRSEADWIVGMNATRNYTVRYGQGGVLWSLGRVQTPVLALLNQRDEEIRHFEPEPFFELSTRYRGVRFKHRGARFKTAAPAEDLRARLAPLPFRVQKVQVKQEQERPPQLYDLTSLQRDMNQGFGMSAADTLKHAQALYEQKLLTYPRTDSRYLPKEMRTTVVQMFRDLSSLHPGIATLDLEQLPADPRIFDDKKVTDHHALLPTGRPPRGLDRFQQQVFDAVLLRTLSAFYPPCKKAVTVVDGQVAEEGFRARGIRILEPGWTALQPKKKSKPKDEADDQQELPAFEQGEQGPHEPEVKEGETRPPRPYTENSLLGVMETAGKLVEDEELREALKSRGLGTPATRANIIETLLRRRYIRRDKKTLQVTDLGRYLCALLRNPVLKSAEMTGAWEHKLHAIERGELAPEDFMAEVAAFTHEVLASSERQRPAADDLGPCPRCRAPVIEGRKGYGCSRFKEGCGFVLWKDCAGVELRRRDAVELLHHGLSSRPVRVDGENHVFCLSHQGLPSLLLQPQREHQRGAQTGTGGRSRAKGTAPGASSRPRPRRQPKPSEPVHCPKCKSGLVTLPDAYACSRHREGCSFRLPLVVAGKKLSKASVTRLLTKGKTSLLKGFKTPEGESFSGRLVLSSDRIRLERDGTAEA